MDAGLSATSRRGSPKSRRDRVILVAIFIFIACVSSYFLLSPSLYDRVKTLAEEGRASEMGVQELEDIFPSAEKGRRGNLEQRLHSLEKKGSVEFKELRAMTEEILQRLEKVPTEKEVDAERDGSTRGDKGPMALAEAKRLLQVKQEEAYQRMLGRRSAHYGESLPAEEFWAYFYYTPMYNCLQEERVGEITDGGKWVCDPTSLNSTSIVYSIGSNGDTSFETDLHRICNGCQIHTFDMTVAEQHMGGVRQAEADGVLTFHAVGLGVREDPVARLKGLKQIMSELGHTYIDIFKIDCEGCEWEFFEDILKTFPPVLFGQLLIELHPFWNYEKTNTVLKGFESHGYRMFHYEINPYEKQTYYIEVCLVHESVVQPSFTKKL